MVADPLNHASVPMYLSIVRACEEFSLRVNASNAPGSNKAAGIKAYQHRTRMDTCAWSRHDPPPFPPPIPTYIQSRAQDPGAAVPQHPCSSPTEPQAPVDQAGSAVAHLHVRGPPLAWEAAGVSGERNGPCWYRDASAPQLQGRQRQAAQTRVRLRQAAARYPPSAAQGARH